MIKIALTKGRLEDKTVERFAAAGYDVQAVRDKGRKLILPVGEDIQVVLAKAPDVLTYVERGVCDAGVVGKDTIMEYGGSYYEVADLGFGKCRFALAVPAGVDFYAGYRTKRIASKYPKVAQDFFARKGMDVEIVKIEGSVELAPLLGLVDGIVDIVETGTTLRENGLRVVTEFMPISARFIANKASYQFKHNEMDAMLEALRKTLQEETK